MTLLEIQKSSLAYINLNLNKQIGQTQVGQNVELSIAKRESETKNTKMDQSHHDQTLNNVTEDTKHIELSSTHLSYTIDENTYDMVISIVDNKSGEIIRRIPPDEVLSMRKRMTEIHSLLFDVKA